MPLLESSIAIFDSASFDLWNPGTTTIKGALFLLVAEFGLYKSKTRCCPLSVGSFIELTSTFPKLD